MAISYNVFIKTIADCTDKTTRQVLQKKVAAVQAQMLEDVIKEIVVGNDSVALKIYGMNDYSEGLEGNRKNGRRTDSIGRNRCVRGSSRIQDGRPTRIRDEHPYFIDIINISLNPCRINPAKIIQMHINDNLSSQQIADKLGISRTTVLKRLRAFNIKKKSPKGGMTSPDNYRAHTPPYGFQKNGYQLAPYPREIKICRMVVQFINEEKLPFSATGRELEKKGLRNRNGNISWSAKTVKAIYERWKEKLA